MNGEGPRYSFDSAVENLDAADVRRHLAAGKSINQRYSLGDKNEGRFATLLHIYASSGDEQHVNFLLQLGADPNVRDDQGQTPLHYAASDGHDAVGNLLLERDADPALVESKFRWTPLHMAAAKGHLEFVRSLIAQGANPRLKGKNGATPLMLAVNNRHQAIARLLAAPLGVRQALERDIRGARSSV